MIDTVFKEGWSVPEDPVITKVKGDEGMNYYMIYSEKKGVGIDELLSFVDKTIKLNLEREKKQDLLRVKVEELKRLFKDNSLTKLSTLKFNFSEEDVVGEFDLNIDEEPQQAQQIEQEKEVYSEPVIYTSEMIDAMYSEDTLIQTPNSPQYVDENGNAIEYTEDELEMIEEEVRAERNRNLFKNKKNGAASKIELPPRVQ